MGIRRRRFGPANLRLGAFATARGAGVSPLDSRPFFNRHALEAFLNSAGSIGTMGKEGVAGLADSAASIERWCMQLQCQTRLNQSMKSMLRSMCLALVLAATSTRLIGCRGLDSREDININPASPRTAEIPIDYLPALMGEYFQVDSEATGRKYHIYIRLPGGYDSRTSGRYPVEQLPEAVIVGIRRRLSYLSLLCCGPGRDGDAVSA